jgi:hypothetical protein
VMSNIIRSTFASYSVKFRQALLVLCITLASSFISVNAEFLSCKNQSGNTIFTDNSSHCAVTKMDDNATGTKISDTTNKSRSNSNKSSTSNKNKRVVSHTLAKCGKKATNKHKVNYCSPRREYQKTGKNWTIYLEQSLVSGDKTLADKALSKLEHNLNEIIALLPAKAVKRLNKLDFYIMWGKPSPNGGRASSMGYFRKGQPLNYHYLDPRWQDVIVIYSAKNLLYLNELWTKKALMHELAHAWHIGNWPDKYPPIYNAYLQAKQKGLYTNVEDYKGKTINQVYALQNQREYFAELSAMYFVGGNYFPYNAGALLKYDKVGEKMIKSLWN